jgi:hypothetical protein
VDQPAAPEGLVPGVAYKIALGEGEQLATICVGVGGGDRGLERDLIVEDPQRADGDKAEADDARAGVDVEVGHAGAVAQERGGDQRAGRQEGVAGAEAEAPVPGLAGVVGGAGADEGEARLGIDRGESRVAAGDHGAGRGGEGRRGEQARGGGEQACCVTRDGAKRGDGRR